jgi:hypothetical protein
MLLQLKALGNELLIDDFGSGRGGNKRATRTTQRVKMQIRARIFFLSTIGQFGGGGFNSGKFTVVVCSERPIPAVRSLSWPILCRWL